MLSWFKPQCFYLLIRCDQFELRDLTGEPAVRRFRPTRPFSSSRLLVGEFTAFEAELGRAIQSMLPDKWIKPRFVLLLHPLERVEGGLAEVERSVFRELAASVGALRWEVVEHCGQALNNDDACARLASLSHAARSGRR